MEENELTFAELYEGRVREQLLKSLNQPKEDLIISLLSKEQSLVDRVYYEDLAREKLYPLQLQVPYPEELPDKKELGDNERRAVHYLGRILDKKELVGQFLNNVPMYYDQANIFWIWDDLEHYWKKIDDLDVLSMLDLAADCNVIASKERVELVNAVKLLARRQKPQDLPKDIIQFKREIINMTTGQRSRASPSYFCKNPIPYRLTPNRDVSKFTSLFRSWVAEKDVEALFEFIGFCLIPDYFIERIFVLFGEGSNGKSVYRKIVRTVLGENNCTSTSLKMLCASPRFESLKLHGKLMCEMGETNLHKLDDTELIKKLSSGKDLIGAEYKGKGHIDFINYAKLLISTNSVPPTDDKVDGFYRRFRIIPFPNQFTEEKDILKDITQEDYEALVSVSLEYADKLLKKREFTGDGTIQHRREQYEHHSNPFDKFYNQFINEDDPNKDIPCWEFEKKLTAWLKENRLRQLSDITIGTHMRQKKVQQVRLWKEWYENQSAVKKQMRCWAGLAWK